MSKIKKNVSSNYQDYFDQDLSSRDPDLYKSIKLELERQQQHIELIASENIVSKGVLDAQGSILTNKKVALDCINTFLQTKFEGGRHLKRVKKI